MEQLYSKRYLLKALKRNRLPFSYVTLIKYEQMGILRPPNRALGFGNGKLRYYTQAEIDEAVNRVRLYQKGQLDLG